jgi:spermidine synthase
MNGRPTHRTAAPGANVVNESLEAASGTRGANAAAFVLYLAAFVTGAIVMSFEMLGSRYLNPYFGSGIYTWASLISTVLAALTVGYFLGGWLADRRPSVAVLGVTICIGSVYLLLLPLFAQPMLEWVLDGIDDVKLGSLLASVAILFFPVTFLGMYSPFAIRLVIRSALTSGTVSGTVYGVSTVGSIVGTLGTTFFLLPSMGSRTLTLLLGGSGLIVAVLLISMPRWSRQTALALAAVVFFAMPSLPAAAADELVDEKIRADLARRADGRIKHIESEYNDIFIAKRGNELTMSFQLKGWDYTESVANLLDADDLPVHYTRAMTTGLAFPEETRRILMIGLGGGSISTYLGRAMPEATIDTVEIDPAVIEAAKAYFGIRESPRVRYLSGDGRVWLKRNARTYDLILVDAFHGGYIPFHLLTKEFYELVKQRLAPKGAAVFNVHDGTKLYVSTVKTLTSVFAGLQLFPSGEGEVAMVATPQPAVAGDVLASRAAALQQRHGFRYPLPMLLAKRTAHPPLDQAVLLTDDFAPVNLYESIGKGPRRKR